LLGAVVLLVMALLWAAASVKNPATAGRGQGGQHQGQGWQQMQINR